MSKKSGGKPMSKFMRNLVLSSVLVLSGAFGAVPALADTTHKTHSHHHTATKHRTTKEQHHKTKSHHEKSGNKSSSTKDYNKKQARNHANTQTYKGKGKATAICNDGTDSYAVHHRGECSHHGGVKKYY